MRIWSAGDQLPSRILAYFKKQVPACWGTFQDIQTYTPKLVDIWVIYLRKESDLWWRHRVVVRKEELEFENAPYNHSSAKGRKGLKGELTFVW